MTVFSTQNPAPSVTWLYREMLPTALIAAGYVNPARQVLYRGEILKATKYVARAALNARYLQVLPRNRGPLEDPVVCARRALGPDLFSKIEQIRAEHPRTKQGQLVGSCRAVWMCAAAVDRDGSEWRLSLLRHPTEARRLHDELMPLQSNALPPMSFEL